MARRKWRRIAERAVTLSGNVLVVVVFLMGLLSVATYSTVQYTARSEFCNSCHIMEPYYESWEHSSHNDVACIECHYEPGAVETLEGKLEAMSQLAKYVTRTAGTKPWAEVSDQSCMRSGCHAVRMLDGPVAFGRVKFDHRHHLLESRRGRRLRCVTCHSQIVQGKHFTVTESVCFACHFMPGAGGERPEVLADCLLCHGPPTEPVEVAGRVFEHGPFIERDVSCVECHDPVIQGEGRVGRERCHSCHAELGHVERLGETPFIHETHVTVHKVECFECHDEIQHGLLPLEPPRPAEKEGCGRCHVSPHGAPELLYAGTGAIGVEDEPSRMYETRVVCGACHTGRTGFHGTARARAAAMLGPAAGERSPHPLPTTVAAAGEADCIHCHGTGYAGMLGDWQGVVGERLGRLRPLLEEIETDAAGSELAPLFEEAAHNVDLVLTDGSRGVHNPTYALAALRASAQRIDELYGALRPESDVAASAGFPFLSEHGCSACHLAAEELEVSVNARPFSHARHLGRPGIDCATCHSVDVHGAPSFPRTDCASCHHQEQAPFDVSDCASCHPVQAGLMEGSALGFEGPPDPMADMDCGDCHGAAPDLVRPSPMLCVLCHEPGYDDMLREWQSETTELASRLATALSAARAEASPDALDRARRALDLVRRDGSSGAHNHALVTTTLESALEDLAD